MSDFRVDWEAEADDRLAEIWTGSLDRQAITNAANRIDDLLRHTPLDVGVVLPEGLRRLTVDPLVVIYSASRETLSVEVVRVRRVR